MIGSFEYNNIESKSFNLAVKSIKRPLIPVLRNKEIIISGKSGIIDKDNNEYDIRQIVMHIAYIGNSYTELRSRAREIAAWLSTTKWGKLIINDEPDKFYLGKIVSEIDLETLGRLGEADITYICQPFAYMVAGTGADDTWEEAEYPWISPIYWDNSEVYSFTATSNKNFTFENPGTKETNYRSPQGSKSLIKINGSWTTLEIELNGNILNYTSSGTGELIIDNVEMEVKLNGANKLSVLDGDLDEFLTILPGDNIIKVRGTGLNITVNIDFIPMWV